MLKASLLRKLRKRMWIVIYGGVHDGHAILVDDSLNEVWFPDYFNFREDQADTDYSDTVNGVHGYERTESEARGWDVSGTRRSGVAFTPIMPQVV